MLAIPLVAAQHVLKMLQNQLCPLLKICTKSILMEAASEKCKSANQVELIQFPFAAFQIGEQLVFLLLTGTVCQIKKKKAD